MIAHPIGIREPIARYCRGLEREFGAIPPERKEILTALSDYVASGLGEADRAVELMVICTHNSRRSHMGQLWLAIGADFYGLPRVRTYSAGTEATAFNRRAVSAFLRIGVDVSTTDTSVDNPAYRVRWRGDATAYLATSKTIDHPTNPREGFAAIMVCAQADAGCPFVPGADLRLSLPYDDPKAADGSSREAAVYDERLREIGREMLFALSLVRGRA